MAHLSDDYENVTGNVLMSAGLIAYLGAFTASYRKGIILEWANLCKGRKIPCADNPSLLHFLTLNYVVIRQWNGKDCRQMDFQWITQLLFNSTLAIDD